MLYFINEYIENTLQNVLFWKLAPKQKPGKITYPPKIATQIGKP